jgi:uncharacterized repeat protein (TIGR03803 family)
MVEAGKYRSQGCRIKLRIPKGVLSAIVTVGSGIVTLPCAEAQAALTYTLVYSFQGGTDGGSPQADLVADAAGNLYGTTFFGGNSVHCNAVGCGTVFRINGAGKERVLHRFSFTDGAYPAGALVRDAAGNLYGTTAGGGVFNCGGGCGTVFKLDTKGKETVLYHFNGAPDGAGPMQV